MNNRFLRFLQGLFAVLDLLTLNLIISVIFIFLEEYIPVQYHLAYLKFVLMLNISWIVICHFSNVYGEPHISNFEAFSRRSLTTYIYWSGFILVCLFMVHQFKLSRMVVTVILAAMGVMVFINRLVYLLVQQYLRHRHIHTKKVIIVGYNNVSKRLVSYFEEQLMNTEIIGYCENAENVHELTNYPILSSLSGVMAVSRQMQVNEIYCSIAPEQNAAIYPLMRQADRECIHFRLVPDLSYFINIPVHIDYLRDMPVISLRKEALNEVGNRIKKRVFDFLIAALIIVFILSWLVPLISLIILLESGWPVFFLQTRSGRNNKNFTCFKFRTMHNNPESHTRQASRNDERLTRVGRFLRRTNLDELPQFFNVLKGEMSIVGPRPHMLKQTEEYSKLLNKYMIRQFLKPGITGWAQVNGFRGETDTVLKMKQRVEHDIWYLENWTVWLDIRIMLLTIYITLCGDKNAF